MQGIVDLWPPRGLKCLVSLDPAKKGAARTRFFQEGEDWQGWAAKEVATGRDTYFAPATYAEQKRTAANALSLGAFWADLDCGPGKDYPDQKAAMAALVTWTRTHAVPFPSHVINSGNGIHAYWRLTEPVPPAEWKPVADRLKAAWAATGLKADPARTADVASIMRLPGTMNFKNGAAKPVAIIRSTGETISLGDFSSAIPGGLPTVAPQHLPPAKSIFAVEVDYPPADPGPIHAKCAQMRQAWETKGAVSEPLWRAALSVWWRCVGNEQLIQEGSKGDPRYDPQETRDKAIRTGGPATCAHFESLNPLTCAECKDRGRLTSPILYGTLAPAAAPPPTKDAASIRLTEVGPYKITDRGIMVGEKDPETNTVVSWDNVTHCPIWVSQVREAAAKENGSNSASYLVEWVTSGGVHKSDRMDATDLYDAKGFIKWLARCNLMAEIIDIKHVGRFMTKYVYELIKEKRVQNFYDHLGWYNDGFVLGSVVVTPDGPKPAQVQSSSPIAKLHPKGDVQVWSAAANVLGKKGYEALAFPLLASFGSPLLALVPSVNAAVLSLVGESGRGKSVSAMFALSVYGNPRHLFQAASATQRAVEMQISLNSNVPFLLDEVTQMKPQRLAEFIMSSANGQGSTALDQARNVREGAQWSSVVMVTTNSAIKEMSPDIIKEHQHQRLLEIHVPTKIQRDDAVTLIRAWENHAGSAGVAYMQYVQQHKDVVPGLFATMQTYLENKFLLPSENRFCIWLLAAAAVGGYLARQAGLIAFNPMPIIEHIAGQHSGLVLDTPKDTDRFPDELAAWMSQHVGDICFWDSHAKAAPAEVPRSILARYCTASKILFIPSAVLRKFLQERGMSLNNLRAWLKQNGVKDGPCVMGPRLPPVWSLHIPLDKLGLKLDHSPE